MVKNKLGKLVEIVKNYFNKSYYYYSGIKF